MYEEHIRAGSMPAAAESGFLRVCVNLDPQSFAILKQEAAERTLGYSAFLRLLIRGLREPSILIRPRALEEVKNPTGAP